MAVCLEVYEDQFSYEVSAEILVTNRDRPERGRMHVADDGALMWECDLGEHGIDTGAIGASSPPSWRGMSRRAALSAPGRPQRAAGERTADGTALVR
jgi:hypothetical protein